MASEFIRHHARGRHDPIIPDQQFPSDVETRRAAIAGPEAADAEGRAIFTAILGWQFPLRGWREQQGMEGGEESVDSRVWTENFERFGPRVVGRTMFDYGYPNAAGADLRCIDTIGGEGAVHLRYDVQR